MDTPVFLKGLIIGLSIAAPVGPIGVLCIRRTLTHGRMSGFATGMGAATADGFYGAVAGFGLTVVSDFLIGQAFWIKLIGGCFLLYLGATTFRSPSQSAEGNDTTHTTLWKDYASTVFLTVTNPMTILSFAAIFAGLGLGAQPDRMTAGLMVAGVFLGSALWWAILTNGIRIVQSKIGLTSFRWINRLSGSVLIGFSALAFWSLLAK